MGDIVGGIFGAVGANQAASAQRDAANIAAQAALTGYNYLTGPGAATQQQYIGAGTSALPNVQNANNTVAQLLGTQPLGANATNGFQNYLGSTGYNFQKQEGINAINSSASAKGLLQSGGTAKSLEQYGQNLASTTFGNYLAQLTGSASSSQNQAALGQTAISQIAGAGSQGGGNASSALIQGGLSAANSLAAGYTNAGRAVGSGINFLSSGGFGGDFSGGGGGY
jgi:hypothetical protein